MTREWDATTYDELPLPHVAWGRRTIGRMNVRGDERVLDAGCGTGRDAAELLWQHPDVDLVGIDGSTQMVDQAKGRLDGRAAFVVGDLTAPLDRAPQDVTARGTRAGRFDAVMSVACFHWIGDHDALFANLAAVMRPGARLTSDSGGAGNIANVERAIASVNAGGFAPKAFATPEGTRVKLARNNFAVERIALRPSPIRIDDPNVMERYLATVCLGSYLERMSADEGAAFTRAVRDAMPEPVLDYVRLEIDAVRR